MRVLFLDDDRQFLNDGLVELEYSDVEVETFTSVESLLKRVDEVLTEPLMLFVDHDLGQDGEGYQAIRSVRERHPNGLSLPIVYLTGRESEQHFLQALRSDPYEAPSAFLSKRELAAADFSLVALIAELEEAFYAADRLARSQEVRRALNVIDSIQEVGWFDPDDGSADDVTIDPSSDVGVGPESRIGE